MIRHAWIFLILCGPCPLKAGHPEIIELNIRRSKVGNYSLVYDARLDEVAHGRAAEMAERGSRPGRKRRVGHPPGELAAGRAEGVSWNENGKPWVNGCYHDTERFRTAGAAVVVDGNYWYSSIVYGGGATLPNGKWDNSAYIGYTPSKGRVRRRVRRQPLLIRFRRR